MFPQYVNILVFIIAFVVAFLIGSILTLTLFKKFGDFKEHRRIKKIDKDDMKTAKKIQKDAKKKRKQLDKQDTEEFPAAHNVVQARMIDKTDSWTDFSCDVDNIDEEELIKKNRKRQTDAYKYIRKKVAK
jgi:hypothetical protein